MTGQTHLGAGIIIGTLAATQLDQSSIGAVAFASSVCIGSLFPDIDIGKSKFGKVIWPISYPINLIFGHRGFIHSPLFYLLLTAILFFLIPQYKLYILAFLIGVISHLILDMFNPAGIPLFYPVKKTYRFARIRSGSIFETVFFIGAILLTSGYWASLI